MHAPVSRSDNLHMITYTLHPPSKSQRRLKHFVLALCGKSDDDDEVLALI